MRCAEFTSLSGPSSISKYSGPGSVISSSHGQGSSSRPQKSIKTWAHLYNAGFKATDTTAQRSFKKPELAIGTDKEPLLRKIEAYLAEAKRPWDYAHGMARRMFKVNRLQWCQARQLHKIVAAMEYDARRHERFTG